MLGFILIIGIIYYAIFEVRKPLPVHVPAESGPVEIPPESLPPEDARLAPVGRSVLSAGLSAQAGRSSRPPRGYGRPGTGPGRTRPAGRRESKATRSTSSSGAPRATPRSWAAWLSARTGSKRLDSPAGTGVVTRRQELVERAFEGLFEHAGEPLRREARRLQDDRPLVREPQPADLEDRRTRFDLESTGHLGRRWELFGVQQHCARRQAESARLLGEPAEVGQIALDGRLGHERTAAAADGAADEPAALQIRQRLAQGEPVDAEPGGELTLGRKTVARLKISRVDRLLDHVADLGVERAFGTRDAAQPRAEPRCRPTGSRRRDPARGVPSPSSSVAARCRTTERRQSAAPWYRCFQQRGPRPEGAGIMIDRARVVVVGGGVGGCSILYWLAASAGATPS